MAWRLAGILLEEMDVDNVDEVDDDDEVDQIDEVDKDDEVDHIDEVDKDDEVDHIDDVDKDDEVDHIDDVDNDDEARMEEEGLKEEEENMEVLQRMIDEEEAQSTKIVKKQSPRECDLCDAVLKNGKAAANHRRNEHERGQFQCKKCGKGFQRRQGLVEHDRGVHEKVTISCEGCGKEFRFRTNLRRHQKDGACRGEGKARIGYVRSEYLPEGWTFRGRNRGLDVLTPEGFKFETYLAISQYMQHKETYTKEQIDRMFCFPDGKDHKKRSMRAEERHRTK